MTAPPSKEDYPARRGHKRLWLGLCLALLATLTAAYLLTRTPRADKVRTDETASAEAESSLPWFRDITADSGLHFTYRNGAEADQYTILESLGGGIALLDYDGDGLLDVFIPGGGYFAGAKKTDIKGHPCRLYRNLGGWKFQNVTLEVGLERQWWYTHGAAVADYDRDGWPDLLVTGYGRLALFHNEADAAGGRHFTEVTAQVGLYDAAWSTSAGWADLDGDGYPDVYVCHYVDWSFEDNPTCRGDRMSVPRDTCPPERFHPLRHALFHNEGGKTFHEVSARQGIQLRGCGLGVVVADLNEDSRPDIYVANDTDPNFLYLNRGSGKWQEQGMKAGVAVDETGRADGSMGVDVGDYDGSGRASLWVTNYQGQVHALYRNLGRELFYHQSRAAGIAAIGQHVVGFGTGFVDVDNDGWEDLVVAQGHVLRYPVAGSPKQRPVLFHNVARGIRRFFKDVSAKGGEFFQTPALGRGLAIGDLDNDGWPDLIISHSNSPVALLRNEAGAVEESAHWLGVRLVGRDNRDVVGSTVIVETEAGRLTRFAKGGGSYLSSGDRRLLFGLGSRGRARRVTVKWSWGRSQSWEDLEWDHYWELHEDQARPRRIPVAASR